MDEKIAKWLNGEISDEELKESVSASDFQKYKQIKEETEKWVPDNDTQIFDPVNITSAPKAKGKSMNLWMPVSIAASVIVAIVAGVWFFLSPNTTTFQTGVAEIKEITLPDGSIVILGPSSEISWDESYAAVKKKNKIPRKVKQKGKAFYDVEKGSPFVVHIENGTVEVLGTEFEVDEFDAGMNVICYEGKVRAKDRNDQSVIIQGGEGFLYYEGAWEEKVEILERSPAWRTSETKFKNAPLIQVVRSLEKIYEIKVVVSGIDLKRRFSGSLPHDQMDAALKLVFSPLGISYELKGDKLYLKD